jgi:tRNA pseudouridine13 synthase
MSERDDFDRSLAWDALPRAWGGTAAVGVIRAVPEDFWVDEQLCFEPDGAGEHLMIHVEKRNANTEWVSRHLARCLDIQPRDVGYAGLKDRHGVTRQWFSLRQPIGVEPDPASLECEGVKVLELVRHGRKLRRGAIASNRFRIRLRQLTGDKGLLEERVAQIVAGGVPNYFGEQRFGHGCGNLVAAQRLFSDRRFKVSRHKRGLYLSAARSFLFNRVLAKRVEQGSWNQGLPGEVMMLDGKRAVFEAEDNDDSLASRLAAMDIHPTGPLWGKGESMVSAVVGELEQAVTEPYHQWREGLARFGLEQERRALRLPLPDLKMEMGEGELELSFGLPSGCFATALLRELLDYRQPEPPADG